MESGGIARMDFELESMSAELGRDVETKLNARLAEDRPVHVVLLPRAQALRDPDLIRTKINLVPPSIDPIRVIDIEGLDKQADGGTHVRSTAEAAMIGGLADWFAVTALFRRPLGLPIPHTAIIPHKKDEIGEGLAGFVSEHFLTPSIVGERARQVWGLG